MIEEGFVQMYVRDFAALATKAEAGQDVEAALERRVREACSHAELMDARKTTGHLEGIVDRLHDECRRDAFRHAGRSTDTPEERERRRHFLNRVADMLNDGVSA